MAYTPKRLYIGQPAFAGTTLYTTTGTTTTILKAITATNTTATSATFSVNIVPSSSSSATFSNRIISSLPLAGNATITFENIGMLNNGDALYATLGTTNSISIHVYGVEVTP